MGDTAHKIDDIEFEATGILLRNVGETLAPLSEADRKVVIRKVADLLSLDKKGVTTWRNNVGRPATKLVEMFGVDNTDTVVIGQAAFVVGKLVCRNMTFGDSSILSESYNLRAILKGASDFVKAGAQVADDLGTDESDESDESDGAGQSIVDQILALALSCDDEELSAVIGGLQASQELRSTLVADADAVVDAMAEAIVSVDA